jgi:hypothetical protein
MSDPPSVLEFRRRWPSERRPTRQVLEELGITPKDE